MRHVLAIIVVCIAAGFLLLSATGCTKVETRVEYVFPEIPPLAPDTLIPCPPLPEITGQLGDLAQKDAQAAQEYARCAVRAATAVSAYLFMQAQMAEEKAKVDAEEAERDK